MKTPEEFEKIALWMGWKKIEPFGKSEVWKRPNGEITCLVGDKTSLTPAECYEALNRLVEKGYDYLLESSRYKGAARHCAVIYDSEGNEVCASKWQSTIAAAIEAALLQLIAAEGGRG